MRDDTRGRVQYPDVILSFATLVTFIAVGPWVYSVIRMSTDVLPPLSATLLRIAISMFAIGMIVSMGVSARTN